MAFETGETFRADIRSRSGSGATGLIQFMPMVAAEYQTTTDALAKMTEIEQLDYVRKYFYSYRGKLKTLEDIYMRILWPIAIGKSLDYVLFRRNVFDASGNVVLDKNGNEAVDKKYQQNSGLDSDNDGCITKKEASDAVRKVLEKGLSKGFYG